MKRRSEAAETRAEFGSGSAPAHWRVAGAGRYARAASGAGFPVHLQGKTTERYPLYKVNALSRADRDDRITFVEDTISSVTANELRAEIFPAGTLVMAKIGAALLLGRVRVLARASCIDNNMLAIVPQSNVDSGFLKYNLSTVDLRMLVNPGAVPSLSERKLMSTPLYWPTLAEQSTIANYLDRETADIDAFIADQEKLIGLLTERRIATVTSTLLRRPRALEGLRAIAKEASDTWPTFPLRRLVASPLQYGANEPADQANPGDVRYLRITDFGPNGSLREETYRTLPLETAREYLVEPGDVLLARSGATVGKAYIVPPEAAKSCFAGYLIRVATRRAVLNPRFFFWFTQTSVFGHWKNETAVSSTIPNIGADRYASLPVPTPPLAEQQRIVATVESEIAEIDATTQDAREAIALSKERRAALISAAVTGRIDVREHGKVNA